MNEFKVVDTLLPEVYLLQCPNHFDTRGDFTKLYHSEFFNSDLLDFRPAESFLTRSRAGVLRGMHYQAKEAAHDKLVFCPKGRVLDVIVDIRPKSPLFNAPISVELSERHNTALLIGKGYAHGFLAQGQESWMMYFTSTVHSPENDKGILWSSISFDWPTNNPVVSERDKKHQPITELR